MMKIQVPKGCFGYIQRKHILEVIKTIIYFSVSISLYFAGIEATGNNRNLLTIVAVLGCLPASKSMVSMIMFLKYKGCPEEVWEKLDPAIRIYIPFTIWYLLLTIRILRSTIWRSTIK